MNKNNKKVNAIIILIGNEILSGRTQDANATFLSKWLNELGVRVEEVRVILDEQKVIVNCINEVRKKFKYVFTTGGIGPTHDDITAECIAAAFNCHLVLDEDAVTCLSRSGRALNPARLKMAHVPEGASLIDNSLSNAPGFRVENVFVLAGVPSVARAMFSTFADDLGVGGSIYSRNVDVFLPEGDIAQPLEDLALKYSTVEIGSYPFFRDGCYGANLVVRGMDESVVEKVIGLVVATMRNLGDESSVGEPS